MRMVHLERPLRDYSTVIDGALPTMDEYDCLDDLHYLYNKWRTIERNKSLKRVGFAVGVAIAIGSIITGLALGLKRSGYKM